MPCVAIIGAGPAGSYSAAELARAGHEVLLFDEKLAWEKPCGGGLTHKALVRWPFLSEAAVERNWIESCEVIAPSGQKSLLVLDRPIAIFSRFTLNSLLLERARSAGAHVIRERVIKAERSGQKWILFSNSGRYDADFLVLAAGARSALRSVFDKPLASEDAMVALGYYIPGTSKTAQIKFVKGLHGYIWIFPRADHFSAGICGTMEGMSTQDLRRLLEECLPEFGLTHRGAQFYAHLIPSLTADGLRSTRYCGEGWAMIGDSAGFVDAITGEGLYYALHSAELFSQAFLSGSPEEYAQAVRENILPELERAARIADRFYSGEWLGAPVLERMVQLTRRSARFRRLMCDLFAGTQEYSTLKRRVRRSLPRITAEALVSTLWKADAVPASMGAD